MTNKQYAKLGLAILTAFYFFWYAVTKDQWHF